MTKTYRLNSMSSLMSTTVGASTAVFARLFIWRRHKLEREQMTRMYNELIARADDHMLYDLGITRDDLFRLRAKLYE